MLDPGTGAGVVSAAGVGASVTVAAEGADGGCVGNVCIGSGAMAPHTCALLGIEYLAACCAGVIGHCFSRRPCPPGSADIRVSLPETRTYAFRDTSGAGV